MAPNVSRDNTSSGVIEEAKERTILVVDCGSDSLNSPRFKRFELQALRERTHHAFMDGIDCGELARAYLSLHDVLDYLDAYQARLEA